MLRHIIGWGMLLVIVSPILIVQLRNAVQRDGWIETMRSLLLLVSGLAFIMSYLAIAIWLIS